MIFVTVGSQKFPFDRLLIEIDRLKNDGTITDTVFAQIGHSNYIPKSFPSSRFLGQETFNEKIEKCDILLTHAGTGVIVKALKYNKRIIAVPRLSKYNEHVDDHQLELIKQFSENNLICSCIEVEDLKSIIETIHERLFQPFVSNTDVFINGLMSTLEHYEYQNEASKILQRRDKLKKYFEYATTKLEIINKQKKYQYNKQISINYIEEKTDSLTLMIIFSSCTRKGIKARYNYVRTLKKFEVDKLFILDDYGYDKRGVYYLGKDMDFSIEEAVETLIQKKIIGKKYKKIVFIGSSKGGYAALNFGLRFSGSTLLIGAPQYRLGQFLIDPENRLDETFRYITGQNISDATNTKIEYLDRYLGENIVKYREKADSIRIYLHYSNLEHTYKEHIGDMLLDLKKLGYKVEEDIGHYENHSEISLYFPNFLLKELEKIVREETSFIGEVHGK